MEWYSALIQAADATSGSFLAILAASESELCPPVHLLRNILRKHFPHLREQTDLHSK